MLRSPASDAPRSPRLGLLLLAVLLQMLLAPVDAAADLDAAREHFQTGRYEECVEHASELVKERPREAAYLLLLDAELALGRHEAARETLITALEALPGSIRIKLLGHEVFRFNDETELAQRMLERIESLAAIDADRYDGPDDLVALGRFLLLQDADPKDVLERYYDRAVREHPDHPAAYLATAELALRESDYALAASTLEKIPESAAGDPEIHYLLARAWKPSDRQRAERELAAALMRNPRHAGSLVLSADAFIDAERYEEAHLRLGEVLEVNPKNFGAWSLRAVLAHLEGDAEQERLCREEALATWSRNPEVDHRIGSELSQKYRFAEGARYQRAALEMNPRYLPAKIQLAEDLLRLGQEEEGWQLAGEVYDADPYNVVAYNLITLRDRLAGFERLEREGLRVRMEPKEAAVYGERVLELLERARQQLGEKYGAEISEDVIVEIFPDQSDFAIRTFGLPGGSGYLGVCFGSVITATSAAARPASPSSWEALLWHEYCHTVTLHQTRNKMPRWLSEGISVYEERQADPGWGEAMNGVYRRMILEGEATPMSQLSAAFLSPPSPLHLQFAYYESSLAVELLIERYGFETLKEILADLAESIPINLALRERADILPQLDEDFAIYLEERARAFAPEADPSPMPESVGRDVASLRGFVSEHPDHAEALGLYAGALLRAEEHEEAKVALTRLLSLQPRDREARLQLAQVHGRLGEHELERSHLEELARLDADAQPAFSRLIELTEEQRDWESLSASAERLIGVNPMLRAGHRALARAGLALADDVRAIEAHRALLELGPRDPAETHLQLARALLRSDDVESARDHVLRALEEAPRYRDAYRTLLEIHERRLAEDEGAASVEAPSKKETSEKERNEKDH